MTTSSLSWAELLSPTRRKDIPRHSSEGRADPVGTGVDRSEAERDYDRILYATPTRRLADKTQIFPLDQNDSISTRLTHSHEVSNLARSIGARIVHDHKHDVFGNLPNDLCVERTVPALLAAAGLAHDLGTPPFGHQGEKTIAQWCSLRTDLPDFTAFDGNCQTFRLLTRLQILNDDFGLDLTCATLAVLLKYPVFSNNQMMFKKFGIFESERNVANEVWRETGLHEGMRHPLAYVLEACDDIAYSVTDAEDIVKKGLASFSDLMDTLAKDPCEKTKNVRDLSMCKNMEIRSEKLNPHELDEVSMQMFRAIAISEMIASATDTFVRHIDPILRGDLCDHFELIANSDAGDLCRKLKDFDKENGVNHPDVLRLGSMGHNYMMQTMDYIWSSIDERCAGERSTPFGDYAYSRIPENYRRIFESGDRSCAAKFHLLCDVVSGMTNRHLISLHDELNSLH